MQVTTKKRHIQACFKISVERTFNATFTPKKRQVKFRYCEKATAFEKNLAPSFEITQ